MNAERLYTVLKGPHVSEKAAMGGEDQVVFKVAVDATKLEVKKAVEKLFKVDVLDVQTVNVKGKVKRNRYGLSKKPAWKKAYVRLAQGQEIDFAVVE
ncbi:MAG: 50S ribosomal protein L23 [Pseudomonadales bacterium]